MSVFLIPSLLALIAKLIVVVVYRQCIRESGFFKLMILMFAFHNLCEVLLFLEYFREIRGDYLLRAYHIISLYALLTIVVTVAEVSNQKARAFSMSWLALVSSISVLMLLSDILIRGGVSLGYVMTAVRGEYYWVFQVAALAIVFHVISLLYLGYKRADSHQSQIRCIYIALALMPKIVAVFAVILLMNLGYHINGVVIFPVATTLFIFIMAISENKHQMTDIRRFIPYSDERRTSYQIMEIFSKYAQDQADYRDSVSEIEKLLVEHKYNKNNRNATYAAERMGMPRSSLYSLFNRLGINKAD